MKRTLLALAVALTSTQLPAATADLATLKSYATKAMQKCPGTVIKMEPINTAGPNGFIPYVVQHTSTDETCGRQAYLLYSPTTQQIVIGSVFMLPQDNRPVNVRIAEHAGSMLKSQLVANVAPFPLPDGLKAVTMTKQTEHGPFNYRGYTDASQRFLIVGTRGNLAVDPGKTLLDSLMPQNGAQRGNKNAKTTIVELSDFECPTCARAHKALEPLIAKNLDKINYIRLDLPLFESHKWSVDAAMAARAIQRVAPGKYWQYVDDVFKNQESIERMSFDTFIKNYAEDHGLDWKALQPIYASKTERAALFDQIGRAFDTGVNSTPTFIINGQMVGYGPEGTFTMEMIKSAMGIKSTPAPAPKKAAAKKPAPKKP